MSLTRKQLLILDALAQGATHEGAVAGAGYKRSSAHYHMGKIREALGAKTMPQAVAMATRSGLLEPSKRRTPKTVSAIQGTRTGEVLRAVINGGCVRHWAELQGLSPGTANSYSARLKAKLGARTLCEAAHVAVSSGWIDGGES